MSFNGESRAGKSGVRALVGALDLAYRAAGVHVASVTVDGAVAPGTEWLTEVVHSGRISAGPAR